MRDTACRGFRALAILSLAGAGLCFLRAPAPAAQAERPVRLGYFIGGRTILFGRAYADGAFEREGVKVELTTRWLRGDLMKVPESLEAIADIGKGKYGKMSGTEITDMMAKGKLDGGLVGEGSFLEAVYDGEQVAAVALLGHDAKEEPGHGIVLRSGIVIRSPADFKGLTLISRRAGPGDSVFLREFLRQEGVPEKNVKIIDQVDDDHIKPMLEDGRADGGYIHLMTINKLIRKKKFYIYRPMNWLDPEIAQAVLIFNRDFLRDHRNQVVKIVAAYMKRIAYERSSAALSREKPGKYGQVSLEGKHGKTSLTAINLPGMSLPVYDYPPKIRLELVKKMETLMLDHGLLKGSTDIGIFVDSSVVNEAMRDAAPAK